jgi:hypothetical protein
MFPVKVGTRALIQLSFGAIVMMTGVGAHAATVTATSSVTGISSSLLTLSNDQYLSDASTPFDSGFDASSVLQNYNFSHTAPNGDTSVATIDNSFAPLPQTSASAINNGQGSATVLWTFDWTATQSGTANINLEYLYDASVFNFAAGESATASSSISMIVDGTSFKDEALRFFVNTSNSTGGFANLNIDFGVTAGQTGTITVAMTSLASATPVPLPAALPFLASGLVGLLGVARRRRQEAV